MGFLFKLVVVFLAFLYLPTYGAKVQKPSTTLKLREILLKTMDTSIITA